MSTTRFSRNTCVHVPVRSCVYVCVFVRVRSCVCMRVCLLCVYLRVRLRICICEFRLRNIKYNVGVMDILSNLKKHWH